jgi:hypothetical protein
MGHDATNRTSSPNFPHAFIFLFLLLSYGNNIKNYFNDNIQHIGMYFVTSNYTKEFSQRKW